MKKRKKMGKSRTGVSVKERIGSMDKFKYDSKPSVLMKDSVEGGASIADRELKRLVRADVFRSSGQTVKQSNSNKRRYR